MMVMALLMVGLWIGSGWADDSQWITVGRGDTVRSLCQRVYHSASREVIALLQQANPGLTDINRIRIGQKLRFPVLTATGQSTARPAKAAAGTTPPPATSSPQESAPPATSDGDRLAQVFSQETTPPEKLLPAGTTMAPGWEAASGTPIGAVEQVQGQAWILHQGTSKAYNAERELPLFSGDTLITGAQAQLRCRLNDKSTFSLAGQSKLLLDKAVYDPAKDRRESALQLLFGRARFIVNHLKGNYRDDYQVRTPTAICGVRGSDFVVAVLPTVATTAKASGWQAIFAQLSEILSPQTAQAAAELALTTTVLSGPGTTVGFSGLTGATQVVTAGAISTAASGGAAISPLGVSMSVVSGALNGVGPLSAVMAMPRGLE